MTTVNITDYFKRPSNEGNHFSFKDIDSDFISKLSPDQLKYLISTLTSESISRETSATIYKIGNNDSNIGLFTPNTNGTPYAIERNWQKIRTAKISEAQYNRIYNLAKNYNNWNRYSSNIMNSYSLSCYLNFWGKIRDFAVEPEIFLCANGNIQAEWTNGKRKNLYIEFSQKNLAYFGMFNGHKIIEGVEDIESLTNLLINIESNPLNWHE